MVALAIATGIAPTAWAGESDETIATALELLQEQTNEGAARRGR